MENNMLCTTCPLSLYRFSSLHQSIPNSHVTHPCLTHGTNASCHRDGTPGSTAHVPRSSRYRWRFPSHNVHSRCVNASTTSAHFIFFWEGSALLIHTTLAKVSDFSPPPIKHAVSPHEMRWFGWAAGVLSALHNVPQIVHVCRRRSASDISGWALAVRTVSLMCYIAHGVLIQDLPLQVMSSIIFVQCITLCVQKHIFCEKSLTFEPPAAGTINTATQE